MANFSAFWQIFSLTNGLIGIEKILKRSGHTGQEEVVSTKSNLQKLNNAADDLEGKIGKWIKNLKGCVKDRQKKESIKRFIQRKREAFWAVVVAQLTELVIPGFRGSYPVIGKIL